MQIGSAASQVLYSQASSPTSLRSPVSSSPLPTPPEPSPDSTVTLSADGTRLAAGQTSASGRDKTDASEPRGEETNAQQAQLDRQKIAQLSSRDAEVRAHEAAHASVGGAYAGAPSYSLQRGPDGKAYAIGGEVGIDVSAVPNDPAATISKMEVVMRAALAPADPSGQDLRVAAQAQGLAAAARAELAQQRRAENLDSAQASRDKEEEKIAENTPTADTSASLRVYQSVASPADSTPQIEAFA